MTNPVDLAAIEVIEARGQMYRVLRKPYWHLSDKQSILLNNARNGEGIIRSVSAIRRQDLNAITFYSAFNSNKVKEDIWEHVRVNKFNYLPSRQHALFLFVDYDSAQLANSTWFAGQKRLVLEARITMEARLHIADATWLDSRDELWESNAAAYWRGDISENPRFEAIVDGAVYFPGWRKKPFGLLGNPSDL